MGEILIFANTKIKTFDICHTLHLPTLEIVPFGSNHFTKIAKYTRDYEL